MGQRREDSVCVCVGGGGGVYNGHTWRDVMIWLFGLCAYWSVYENLINIAVVACMQHNLHWVVTVSLLTVLSEGGLDDFPHPVRAKKKEVEVLMECPFRSHQMWAKGIKDSFEGRWERLHTVLTPIQIPSKSLYITLIKPCAVQYTNSHWSYHKATMYHGCLVKV